MESQLDDLLNRPPFGQRDDDALLAELNDLTHLHLAGCAEYRRVWPDWRTAESLEELPFLHVGVFKHIDFRTQLNGVHHQRVLNSSSTTTAQPSRIALDDISSSLQAKSTLSILKHLVGPERRPLLVLDNVRSLRQRGVVSARIAAAMSLKPLASEIHFLIDEVNGDQPEVRWSLLRDILSSHSDLLIYGFTWVLWQAWANAEIPDDIQRQLTSTRMQFVHSGGWKKLESIRVNREEFDRRLKRWNSDTSVIDYYGLVEQVGMIYPLCEAGSRHVPSWGAVIVRDPWTQEPIQQGSGMLQLMNILARGAPYHSVLTEDLGHLLSGECPCGRSGQHFVLDGRIPKSETRGCANV